MEEMLGELGEPREALGPWEGGIQAEIKPRAKALSKWRTVCWGLSIRKGPVWSEWRERRVRPQRVWRWMKKSLEGRPLKDSVEGSSVAVGRAINRLQR